MATHFNTLQHTATHWSQSKEPEYVLVDFFHFLLFIMSMFHSISSISWCFGLVRPIFGWVCVLYLYVVVFMCVCCICALPRWNACGFESMNWLEECMGIFIVCVCVSCKHKRTMIGLYISAARFVRLQNWAPVHEHQQQQRTEHQNVRSICLLLLWFMISTTSRNGADYRELTLWVSGCVSVCRCRRFCWAVSERSVFRLAPI